MATTRIIPMHQNKGKTIRQCLSDRLDYGKNPDKTQEGQLISAYACDPETADAESIIRVDDAIRWQSRKPSLSVHWKQNRIRDAAVTTICLSRTRLPNNRPGHFCIISSMGLPAQMILMHLPNRWKPQSSAEIRCPRRSLLLKSG